jgi:CBS domain-containing protein
MENSIVADRIFSLLGSTPAFDRLPEDERRRLLGKVNLRYFGPDEVILEQGTTAHKFLYIIESGYVRLAEKESGRLVDEYGEGDIFGNYGLMTGGPLPFEVRIVEPTVCVLIGAEDFRELYDKHEEFAAFFDKDLRDSAEDGGPGFDASGSRLLFGTTIGELVGRGPVLCPPRATAREAAQSMRDENADSVIIMEDERVLGILTDIDLRNKIVAEGAPPETPVEDLMHRNALRLAADAPVFQALMEMMQYQTYHVVVSESAAGSNVLGVISDKDISRAQGNSPAFMTERVEQTNSPEDLYGIRGEIDKLLIGLERQGVKPKDLVTINTELNDHLMKRLVGLVEAEMREENPELYVDLPWAWLSLGSEGRGEMSLLTDQDNALLYADPAYDEEAERAEEWFRALAWRTNEVLAEAGFALCEGDIMARNPKWRQSLSGWKETFRGWILTPDADVLVLASTFFDLRGLYGEMSLVDELKSSIFQTLEKERRFLPFMVQNALGNRPPLSFFRRFVLERSGEYRHTFNIKRRGLRPLVDAARIFAIELRYLDSANTVDRFEHIAKEMPGMASTVEDALDAYNYLDERRFIHHLRTIEREEKLNNQINPSDLNNTQQNMLKVVFATVQEVQEALARRYGINTRL